jgi:hypothetical protein
MLIRTDMCAQAPLLDVSRAWASADMLLLSKVDLVDARIAADFGNGSAAKSASAPGAERERRQGSIRTRTET